MPPVTLMALVVGPIEPATKRGFPVAGEFVGGLAREFGDAMRLIFRAFSPKPYSARTTGALPNELVSMMSEPASRYLR